MIQAMKFVRCCTFVAMCLNSSFVVAMASQHWSHYMSGPKPLFPQTAFTGETQNKFLSAFVNRLGQMDWQSYKTFVVGGVANNPGTSISMLAIFLSMFSEMIPKNHKNQMQEKFNNYVKPCCEKYYSKMPGWLQMIVTGIKACFFKPLASCSSYIIKEYQTYAAISMACLGVGRFTDHPTLGAGAAIFFVLTGLNQEGFRQLVDKINANQIEINKNFDSVKAQNLETHQKIEKLSEVVNGIDDKINNLGKKTTLNHQETNNNFIIVQEKLIAVNQELQESFKLLGDQVSEDVKQLAQSLSDNIDKLEGKLKEELNKSINSLSQQMTEGNEATKEVIKKALEQRLTVFSDLLMVQARQLNQESKDEAVLLRNDINKVSSLVTEHLLSSTQQIQELEDFFTQKLNDLEIDVKELGKKMDNIKCEIHAFNENVEKQTVEQAKIIVEKIEEVRKENQKAADSLNKTFFQQITDLVEKVEKQSVNVIKTQDAVDALQTQHNECVNIMNVLQKSSINHDAQLKICIERVETNEQLLSERFKVLEITSTVMREEIKQLHSEIRTNSDKMDARVSKISVDLSDIKHLATKIDIENESRYEAMHLILDRTTEIASCIKNENNGLKNSLMEQLRVVTEIINQVYDKFKLFEEAQAAQKEQIDTVSRHQAVQGNKLDVLVSEFEEMKKKHESLLAIVEAQGKKIDNRIDSLEAGQNTIISGQQDLGRKFDIAAAQGSLHLNTILHAVNNSSQKTDKKISSSNKKKNVQYNQNGGSIDLPRLIQNAGLEQIGYHINLQ